MDRADTLQLLGLAGMSLVGKASRLREPLLRNRLLLGKALPFPPHNNARLDNQ